MIGREAEKKLLKSLIDTNGFLAQNIFLYGPAGCGKTCTVNHVTTQLSLKSDEFLCISYNCIESCLSAKLLYDSLLYRLCQSIKHQCPEFSSSLVIKCDNGGDFVNSLHHILNAWIHFKDDEDSSPKICFVLDNADRLRDLDATVLPVLLRLSELLTGPHLNKTTTPSWSTNVMFISQCPWDTFCCGTFFHSPYQICFDNYSQEQLKTILSNSISDIVTELNVDNEDSDSKRRNVVKRRYALFVKLLIDVSAHVCRNAAELIYLAQSNWPLYNKTLDKGGIEEGDQRSVWKLLQPLLKRSLESVYLREVVPEDWQEQEISVDEDSDFLITSLCHEKFRQQWLELPLLSKYLLISAYLASYNPSSSDKKYFVKNTGKLSSRIKQNAKKYQRTSNHLIGPKAFPFDRLMAIFYAICEDRVTHTVSLAGQIASLVQLHLLAQVGSASDTSLSNPKFKCLISLDTAKLLARTVDLDILQYLSDFS